MILFKTLYTYIGVLGFAALLPAQIESITLNRSHLSHIDSVIERAIENEDIPGAAIIVGDKENIYYRKAFGHCQLVPDRQKMQLDMLFDMASVTKPVATATSVMILVERGDLRLTDRISDYVDSFSRYIAKDSSMSSEARIYHLLNHTSGLPAYTNAETAAKVLGTPASRKAIVDYLARLPKLSAPGDEYRYSCLGYITLGYIVEKISGLTLHDFSQQNIFGPLNMENTTFIPSDSLRSLCVPTELVDGKPFRGVVHDPLARLQGGVSGNAGLFSTVDDMSTFVRMLMNGGTLNGMRIISPLSVARMSNTLGDIPNLRYGYGWVVKKGVSWVGGDLFPDGGFGHTGYTGTSVWIDPSTELYIVLLFNRVHPEDDGSVSWLRSSIANIVAGAVCFRETMND